MENSEKNKMENSDSRIVAIRNEIDNIDTQVLKMLNKRLELALEIGKAKAEKGAQVLDNTREATVLKRVAELNKGPLSPKAVQQIFIQIMAASRELQKSHRVTYLGPEATFTHMAAMNHFGNAVSYIPQPSIRDVFKEVEKDACHYGVVPVENSIEGAVNHTLDLFFESELKICAETYQHISHDLVSASGSLKDIQIIYSHPQAFAQCRRWLQKYLPDVPLEECSSTAEAARKTLEEKGSAAISSSEAAQMYKLQVVASRIEDIARNTTRFLIIGRDEVPLTGNDKTSIMFVTSHVPGALFRVLKPMADSGVNMVKLESRPTKHENWSYFFFVDVEGHVEEEKVRNAMEEMKPLCLYMKWLGSYPRAKELQ